MNKLLRTAMLLGTTLLAGAGGYIASEFNQDRKPVTSSPDYSTAFRYWLDGARNNNPDGRIAPDEFMGRDTRFKLSNEKQLCFGSYARDHKGDTIHFTLFNPNNNPVLTSSDTIKTDDYAHWVKYNAKILEAVCATPGEYIVVWEVAEAKNPSMIQHIDEYRVFLEK